MKFSFAGHAKSLAVSVLILLFSLTATTAANAASFNFNNPVGGGNYPTCSGGTWSSSGSTYTCTGSITLASGDNMLPSNGITVIANNGFTLSGNNTIGSAANNVNLQTAWTGITAGSGVAIYGNVAVTGGSIVLQGGSVSGSVSSNCCAISTTNTNISGGISSSSNSVTINGGTISGAISSSGGGGISISNATVTSGSITAGTVPIVISNSTIGSVASPVTITGSNTVTISSSTTVYGSITAGAWPGTVVVDGSSSVVGNCVPNHARCEGVTFPANQCAADRFGDDLVCTANDVAITGMQVVGDTTSCVGGTFVTLDLQMSVNFAVPDRWDIGIFISNDGKNPETRAANGGAATCAVSVLPTASPFLNLDGGATGDTCGDGNGSIGGGTGTGIHYMSNVTVPCQSLAGASGQLYIPFVVSWDNQQSPSGALCTSNLNPVPNTKSKCNAPTVVQGTVGVVVLPSITKTDNQTKVNGQSQVFSGTASTYQITVTNSTGVAISNVNFKDPAVSGIDVTNVSCAASSGASCPAGTSATLKSAMQGSGLTLPTMAAGSSLTFTVTATLTGTPGNVRTNTATVTVGGQTNTASDTAIIVDTFALLPTTQAKSGDSGALVPYTYTLYNFGNSAATFSLSAVSSKWSSTVSPTSVTVPAGGSTNITVTVTVGNGALGAVDITTLTATSPSYPGKTATATAVTTKTAVLTLTPSNTGSAGAGSYVYYSHRVQNNDASSKAVALTPSFTSGTCTGWSSTLLKADKSSLTSPVTLAASGGYLDFLLRVYVAPGAAQNSTCTATLTAAYTSGTANSVSVTDVTTVKRLMLYEDAGYSVAQDTYPAGNRVYAQTYGLTPNVNYYYEFLDPAGNVVCRDPSSGSTFNVGTTWTTSCLIPSVGPLGTWTARIFNTTNTVTPFASEPFYVGPDHVKASYTGGTVTLNTDVAIDLALHDKTNHVVPFDTSSNLVKGGAAEEALFITVTVSGSAQIVSTTLTNASISGQTVTGRLNSTTGTATLTLRNSLSEVVTVTPASANGKLIGSTVRDEPATVTFFGVAGPDYLRIEHDGEGLTCMPESVTVRACSGVAPACSEYVGSVTATLSPSGWVGGNTITFVGGHTTVQLSKTTVGSVTLGAGSINPVPPNGVKCYNGATETCAMNFVNTGFIFTTAANVTTDAEVVNQEAGTAFGPYWLRAVRTDDKTKACEAAITSPQTVNFNYVCADPATCSSGNQMTIGSSPVGASATGLSLSFDANGNASLGSLTYFDVGSISLVATATVGGATLTGTLGGSGGSPFVVKPYSLVVTDIKQTAAPNLANPAAASAAGSLFIYAGENFSATVTAVNASCAASLSSYTLLTNIPASCITPNFGREAVPETVTLSNSLVSGLGLANNPTLNNPAVFGAFSNGSATGTTFSWDEVGIITLTPSIALQSGETLVSYLGAGNVTGTASGKVGRFYPHHLGMGKLLTTGLTTAGSASLVVTSATGVTVGSSLQIAGAGAAGQPLEAMVTAVAGTTLTLSAAAGTSVPNASVYLLGTLQNRSDLSASGSSFSYMGEPIKLTYYVTAYNKTEGVTQNYAGSFAKLNAGALELGSGSNWFSVGCTSTTECMGLGAVNNSVTGLTGRLSLDTSTATYNASLPSSSWATGVGTFEANIIIGRASSGAPDGPYDVLKIGAMPRDSDGVTLPTSGDALHQVNLDASPDTPAALDGTRERHWLFDTQARYGRLKLSNAYGSERLPLSVPIEAQYYDSISSLWLTNTLDSGSTSLLLFPVTVAVGGATPSLYLGPSLANGSGTLTVGAPGSGNTGSADLTPTNVEIPAYLKWPWAGCANPAAFPANCTPGEFTDPSARITFGVYRGNNRIIYRRERY